MSINNRVFGSDIPNKVKKTLEARQLAAQKTRNPNEQITNALSGTLHIFRGFSIF